MTPIRQVNATRSAGERTKQLRPQIDTGSRWRNGQHRLQHIFDNLPLGDAACQEPGRSDQAQYLPNSAILVNDRFGRDIFWRWSIGCLGFLSGASVTQA